MPRQSSARLTPIQGSGGRRRWGEASQLHRSRASQAPAQNNRTGGDYSGRARRLFEDSRQWQTTQEAETKGMKTRAEYLAANSLSREKPWKVEGISRAEWYRRRTKAETSLAGIKLTAETSTCLKARGIKQVGRRLLAHPKACIARLVQPSHERPSLLVASTREALGGGVKPRCQRCGKRRVWTDQLWMRCIEQGRSTPQRRHLRWNGRGEWKMLKLFLISDPRRPGSPSIALARDKHEQTLRDNGARQNLICGPGRSVEHPVTSGASRT